MAYALGILVVWGLVCVPIGLLVHRLTLGPSACAQALPVAFVSGLAMLVIGLSASGQAGVSVDHATVGGFAAAMGCIVYVWRSRLPWHNRELLFGALPLLVLGVLLASAAAWRGPVNGPLGFGTGREPETQVAEIRNLVRDRVDAEDSLSLRAHRAFENATDGVERLAAFTVSAGKWDPYDFQALVGALLAALVALPAFLFARWRQMSRTATVVVVIAAAVAPISMLNLALGDASAVAAGLFGTMAIIAVALARRDRGWLALAAIDASAALVVGGPIVLVPIAAGAFAWRSVTHGTREHKAQVDRPLDRDIPTAVGTATTLFALYASADGWTHTASVPWRPVFERLGDSITAWPFVWLDAAIQPASPTTVLDWGAWGAAIALATAAAGYGWRRRMRHEVGAIVAGGAAVGAAFLAWIGLPDGDGRSVIEFAWVATTPTLLIAIARICGDARAVLRERYEGRRFTVLPGVLATALVLGSIGVAGSTGSRVSPAPRLVTVRGDARTLVATDVAWVDYVVPSTHVFPGRLVDADELAGVAASRVLTFGPFTRVVLPSDPFASDPPGRYEPDELIPGAPVRTFSEVVRAQDAVPLDHAPVEETPGASPGGLLVPGVDRDGETRAIPTSGADCGGGDYALMAGTRGIGSAIGGLKRGTREPDTSTNDTAPPVDDATAPPRQRAQRMPETLHPAAIACWSTPLSMRARSIVVHLRDVGTILPLTRRGLVAGRWMPRRVNGHPGFSTVSPDARAHYAGALLTETFDIALEGRFPPGVKLLVPLSGGSAATSTFAPSPSAWSQTFSGLNVSDEFDVIAPTSASRLDLARAVLRRTMYFPTSCELVLEPQPGRKARFVGESGLGVEIELRSFGRKDGKRVANFVVRNSLNYNQHPQHVLVDWVEQYDLTPKKLPPSYSCVAPLSSSFAAAGQGATGAMPGGIS